MRALIIASVSAAIVTVPLSTSFTKFLTRSLPRSFAAASRPRRPSSTILSSRLSSGVGANCCCDSDCACISGICASLRNSDLGLEFLQRGRIVERALEDFVELVVPLQIAAQIGELGAQVEQLLQRLHLLRDAIGREVVQ